MRTALLLAATLAVMTAAHAAEPLDPKRGAEIGTVIEAFLTPHQEPGEEKDTPRLTPDAFRSTAPSLLRADRKGRGHGRVSFTKDLSRAFVEVVFDNVTAADVAMFHIHCGRPDQLGPIIVDFGHFDNVPAKMANGTYTFEVTNAAIEATAAGGHGLIGAVTAGCPVVPDNPVFGKVKTVAGMEYIARKGELYFNLHTKGQMFFGDIRGQLIPVTK